MDWVTVAPIISHYTNIGNVLSTPFYIDEELSIGPIPKWFQRNNFIEVLSEFDRQTSIMRAEYAFIATYAADELGSPDPKWSGDKPRSVQDSAYEKILFSNVALWLSDIPLIFFRIVVDFEKRDQEWHHRQIKTVDRFFPNSNDLNPILNIDNIKRSKSILSGIYSLERGEGSVWIAVRTLKNALRESILEIRYLLFWIALESLFGPKDPRETTYRISQRIALFLGKTKEEAVTIFRDVKRLYEWRSRVVHGMRLESLKKKEKEDSTYSNRALYSVECYLRHSLNKIFSEAESLEVFNGSKREGYLEELVFKSFYLCDTNIY